MEQEKQQAGFDVDGWLAQGKQALGALHTRKRDNAAKRLALDKEDAEIDTQISAIEAVFGAHTPERRTGVIDLCRVVIGDDTYTAPTDDDGHSLGFTEDNLVLLVLDRDPLMKDSSIRAAFRNIAKKGELERIGKRGAYRYRRVASQSEVAKTVTPREKLWTKLISVGKAGLPIKDLAWVLGDEDATLLILDGMMGDGSIETFPVGEGVFHYRVKEHDAGAEDNESTEGAVADLEQTGLFGGTAPAE
jgi:hypothetical protein